MYSRVTTESGAERTADHGENGESLLILTVNRAAREQAREHYIRSYAWSSWWIGIISRIAGLLILVYVRN